MGIETLTPFELMQGVLTLSMIVVTIIIGLKILVRYFSTQQKIFITVGLSWIFLSSGWWGASLSFLSISIFNTELNDFWYIFLSNALIPIALMSWMYSFTTLISSSKKKTILIIYLIISILFEVFFIIFAIIDINLIATKQGLFETSRTLFTLSYLLFGIVSALVSGIIFTMKSLKDKDPTIKWKGRFLLLAFIFFAVGAFLDSSMPRTPLTLVLFRLILILSSAFYYFGFFLPQALQNRISKT